MLADEGPPKSKKGKAARPRAAAPLPAPVVAPTPAPAPAPAPVSTMATAPVPADPEPESRRADSPAEQGPEATDQEQDEATRPSSNETPSTTKPIKKRRGKRDRSRLPQFDDEGQGESDSESRSDMDIDVDSDDDHAPNADKPTPAELYQRYPANRKRVYRTKGTGRTAVFHCLKNDFLGHETKKKLASLDDDMRGLVDNVPRLSKVDFASLREPDYEWEQRKSIDPDQVEMMDAALVHYDMDYGLVYRYLSGKWSGKWRNTEECVAKAKDDDKPSSPTESSSSSSSSGTSSSSSTSSSSNTSSSDGERAKELVRKVEAGELSVLKPRDTQSKTTPSSGMKRVGAMFQAFSNKVDKEIKDVGAVGNSTPSKALTKLSESPIYPRSLSYHGDDEDEFIADPDSNERQFGDSTVISNWEERSGAEESGGQDEAGPDVDNTGARTNGKDDEESDSESSSRSSSSSGSGESGSDESSDESSDERQGRQAKCKSPSKGDGSETRRSTRKRAKDEGSSSSTSMSTGSEESSDESASDDERRRPSKRKPATDGNSKDEAISIHSEDTSPQSSDVEDVTPKQAPFKRGSLDDPPEFIGPLSNTRTKGILDDSESEEDQPTQKRATKKPSGVGDLESEKDSNEDDETSSSSDSSEYTGESTDKELEKGTPSQVEHHDIRDYMSPSTNTGGISSNRRRRYGANPYGGG